MPDQIDRSELVVSVGSTRATSSRSHGEEISDSERVPTSLMEIAPILRLAKKIERFNYRVAYLCRYHALEKAHKLDPNSSGHGVRFFKTALINRLRKDDEITKGRRQREDEKTMGKRMGDAREMERFYKTYHDFNHALLNDDDEADGSQLTTDGILFDVAEAVHQRERDDEEVPAEFLRFYNDVEENTQIYVPYNILPLDPDSENQTIMSFPEIKAAVMALRSNVRNLPWPENQKNKRDEDMLDWLQTMFGFQNDNVSNQRENLVLLLANVQCRKFPNEEPPELEEGTLDTVMGNVLENYIRWYKFLDLKDSKWSPHIEEEKVRQRKLLYIGLYLLIWGEAANIRFMPECLCYIYHHMAFELFEMLERRVNEETRKPAKPAYGGEDEAFLKNVVTPIYQTIAKEAKRGRGGKHSEGRNYDDLNEYFWSKKTQCNRQKWIEETDHADFFSKEIAQGESENKPNTGDQERTEDEKSAEDIAPEDPEVKPLIDNVSKPITVTAGDGCVGKVNFVERRSFLHLFRSFDRMWTSYILCLQAMIIIAWNEDGDSEEDDVFNTVLSIFITTAILNLAQALVDIVLTWNALHSMTFYMQLRYLLKAVAAVIWAIIFSINYYTHNRIFSSFAIVIYLSSSMLMAVMFLCLFFRCHLKRLSQNKIVKLVMWWYQPRLYVGSGMHENAWSFIKYMMFWIFLLILKFGFSYYAEIKPLVGPTKEIMRLHISVNRLPELFAPGKAMNNIVLVITLWSPVILVYFMDTQIWYATLSTLVGSTIGAYQRLGEVQTLGMLRTRFQYLSGVFNDLLVPISKPPPPGVATDQVKLNVLKEARFSQMWNKIITSFREEDLINNREMDLLLVPYWKKLDAKKEQDPTENEHQDPIRWPLFLLTSKIPVALEMTKDSNGKDSELRKRLRDDIYMTSAVNECYASFKILLNTLVVQEQDVLILDKIFTMIDNHIDIGTLITSVNWSVLPDLYDQFVELTDHLLQKETSMYKISRILLNMLEMVESRLMKEDPPSLRESSTRNYFLKLHHPVGPRIEAWEKNINRLYLLLTVKDSAMDVPSNLEARRRLTFFSNSLFMEMPEAPKIRNMLSFSALTPYHEEEVRFSILDLKKQNEDGISILFYLKKIFPDEWMNFLERVECGSEKKLLASSDYLKEKLSMWGSYRGQTLAKTVRGMMYYRKAFKLQAFFDLAKKEELMSGYKSTNPASERAILRQTFIYHATDEDLDKGYKAFISEGESESAKLLWAKCQALADMKFTYVVSCQQYSKHKRTGNPRAAEISRLMNRYPSLRVAYIDEVKKIRSDSKGNVEKIYYSALVKSDPQKYGHQVIYRIKLPGDPMIGEGKPENQNHAIIFTRGEALQTIDMNQDNYMEEAFKMRNLLQEFVKDHGDVKSPAINLNPSSSRDGTASIPRNKSPTILGLREHIFTGSVSSLAWFMSNQENSFVTLGQRVLANPLKVRFHYGHPDVFDRLFHLTRGGVSKASKTINLSEDIFAGFNSILREGKITHHEYIQVGKGRDVGLNQISMFEAKIANGSGEQTLSRDLYRLGHRFDFFRMLSCYFTTVGFYFCSMLTVLTVYVFLYGRLYLALSGLEEEMWNHPAIHDTKALQAAIASQSIVQIGFLMAMPMIMVIGLERGFHNALFDFVLMQVQLAPVFFTFQLGTKAHYYGRTLMHGGAKYIATGRGFVVFHAKFAENYRMYSRSHFVKAFELAILLLMYHMFGRAYMGAVTYLLITFSIWFMVGSWLFAPFLFNPSGFEWHKIVEDWEHWTKWIYEYDYLGIGALPEKSWESWWEKEQEHLQHSDALGFMLEIVLASRFFIFQYMLVYKLTSFEDNHSIWVYVASWLVILIIMLIVTILGWASRGLGKSSQFVCRTTKIFMFLAFLAILITLICLRLLTFKDIFLCMISFILTGWGILLISQACKQWIQRLWIWSSVRTLAWGYDLLMGFLLFIPVGLLAWFPFVSEFQTRILFNQAFSRGLQISHIIGGQSST